MEISQTLETHLKKYFSLHECKMGKKESLIFDDVETEKKEFYCFKSAVPLGDRNIDKIVVSEE